MSLRGIGVQGVLLFMIVSFTAVQVLAICKVLCHLYADTFKRMKLMKLRVLGSKLPSLKRTKIED